MISGLGAWYSVRGKRSAPLPGPLQGCFLGIEYKALRSENKSAVSVLPSHSPARRALVAVSRNGRTLRSASRCSIDSAPRGRADGAALAAEARRQVALLLEVPARSRPHVLRLCRRWGLLVRRFGRCFPGRSGPDSGWIQFFRPAALVPLFMTGDAAP